MADTKTTALSAFASLASGDLLVGVEDPGGTPVTKKLTVDALDTYLSATTGTLTNKTINTASNTITIVEADISDLGTYLTDITGEALSDLGDVTITAIASGEILKWNGSAWINNTLAEAGILGNVSEDTTPQLGGNLDVNGNSIVSASNGDITITPNGTGSVVLDGLNWPQADGTADYVLKTDGAGQLSWTANTGSGLADIVDDTTPQLGAALDGQGFDLNNMGVLFLTEQAAAEADVAGKGQLWVKSDTPNTLYFTDDAGTDFQLNGTEVTGTSGQIYVFNGSNDLAAVAMSGGATISNTGVVTISNFADGELVLDGSTSGTTTVNAPDVAGTTVITLPSSTGTLATTVQDFDIQFSVDTTGGGDIILHDDAGFGYTINSLNGLVGDAISDTATIKINTTTVTGISQSISTTKQTTADPATAANTVSAGDEVYINVGSTTSTFVSGVLHCSRTLA